MDPITGNAAGRQTSPFREATFDHHGDVLLAEKVREALRAAGYGPLRRILVTTQESVVLLSGRVPTYYLKQVAQAVALAVPGIHHVRNEVDVFANPGL